MAVHKPLRERVAAEVKFTNNTSPEDMSDSDFRRAIDKALRATEPGYLGIVSVFPADSVVVYEARPGDDYEVFSRTYKINDSGIASLKDDREKVQPVTRFEPVNASMRAACGCGGHKPTEGDSKMHRNADRIKALIANAKSPFNETHQPVLEACTDEQLKSLEDSVKTVEDAEKAAAEAKAAADAKVIADAAAATVAAETAAAAPKPVVLAAGTTFAGTAEQFIAMAPAGIRESLQDGLRLSAERRNSILTALKATGRCEFTDAELAPMSTDGLERLLKLAGAPAPEVVASSSFLGVPLPRAAAAPAKVSAPPDMFAGIKK